MKGERSKATEALEPSENEAECLEFGYLSGNNAPGVEFRVRAAAGSARVQSPRRRSEGAVQSNTRKVPFGIIFI